MPANLPIPSPKRVNQPASVTSAACPISLTLSKVPPRRMSAEASSSSVPSVFFASSIALLKNSKDGRRDAAGDDELLHVAEPLLDRMEVLRKALVVPALALLLELFDRGAGVGQHGFEVTRFDAELDRDLFS
jgi:hypothetical protein